MRGSLSGLWIEIIRLRTVKLLKINIITMSWLIYSTCIVPDTTNGPSVFVKPDKKIFKVKSRVIFLLYLSKTIPIRTKVPGLTLPAVATTRVLRGSGLPRLGALSAASTESPAMCSCSRKFVQNGHTDCRDPTETRIMKPSLAVPLGRPRFNSVRAMSQGFTKLISTKLQN